jgi:hypothetical protein
MVLPRRPGEFFFVLELFIFINYLVIIINHYNFVVIIIIPIFVL